MEEVKTDRRRRCSSPSLPTLWPSMLLAAAASRAASCPSRRPTSRYFYFARNAVWLTVKMLRLDEGEVLMPAYHHGVEVEARGGRGRHAALLPGGRALGRGPGGRGEAHQARRRRRSTSSTTRASRGRRTRCASSRTSTASRSSRTARCRCCRRTATMPLGTTGRRGHLLPLQDAAGAATAGALTVNGPRQYSLPEPPAPPLASTFSHTVSALLQNLELRGGAVGRGAARPRARPGPRHGEGREHRARGHRHPALRPDARGPGHEPADPAHRPGAGPGGHRRDAGGATTSSCWAGCATCPRRCSTSCPRASAPCSTRWWWRTRTRCWRGCARGASTPSTSGSTSIPRATPSAFPEVAQLRRTILEIPCHQDLTPEVMADVAAVVRGGAEAGAAGRQQARQPVG